jgi:ABC-type uncharacterized transport system auxiliary subunit
MMKKSFVMTGALISLLAACSLGPRDTGKAFLFSLPAAKVTARGQAAGSLVVALPTTSPELDTFRIALIRPDGRWDYYAGTRWAEFLPMLVQDSLAETLGEARIFESVATDQTGLAGDKLLKTEIRLFQAEYTPHNEAPVAKVRIAVSLLTRLERTPLAFFTVNAEKRATGNRLADIQAAFAAAFSTAQQQMADKLAAARK